MSATFAKRVEVRKLSELACNIKKYIIRTASNSVPISSHLHQRSRLPLRRNLFAARFAHNFGQVASHSGGSGSSGSGVEHTYQQSSSTVVNKNKLHDKTEATSVGVQVARSHSHFAVGGGGNIGVGVNVGGNSARSAKHAVDDSQKSATTMTSTTTTTGPQTQSRSVHSDVARSRSAHQPYFSSISAPSVDLAGNKLFDRKEGPCKRTLRNRVKEQKIVPTYLRLVEEPESDTNMSNKNVAPRRRRSGRSTQQQLQLQQQLQEQQMQQQQQRDMNDIPVVYPQMQRLTMDDSAREAMHHMKFGRREIRSPNMQSQLDEARLQQSLSLFSEKKLTGSGTRKGSLYVHPKYEHQRTMIETAAASPPTQKELREAKFGQTLNTLADQKLFKVSSLYTHDFSKFPIEDELRVQKRLLEKQRTDRLRAAKEAELLAHQKPNLTRPTVSFGRRRGHQMMNGNTYQNPDLVESEFLNEHDNNSAIRQFKATAPTVDERDPCMNSLGAIPPPANYTSCDNIYKKFLQTEGKQAHEEVEIDSPRFDDMYYRESDQLVKSYSQTWADYPDSLRNIIPAQVRLVPPPFRRRPKDERPSTAKPWGDVDEHTLKF